MVFVQFIQQILRAEFIVVFRFQGDEIKGAAMHGNIGYKIGEGRHITKNMVAFFQKQSVDQIQTADGAIAEGDVFIIQFGIILPVMDHAVFDCKGMGIRTQHFELQFMESLFCRGGIRYDICAFGAVDIIGSGACAFHGIAYFCVGFDDAVDFQFHKNFLLQNCSLVDMYP